MCQFISPSQLREGTTSPPTLESLKLHCDQAERLRTKDLEERCLNLERELDLAAIEGRIQSGYIDNLKVYEGIMNAYLWKLRERLEELDPDCKLLQFRIPLMPRRDEIAEVKKTCVEDEMTLLSEVLDGKMNKFTKTDGRYARC